MNLNNNQTKNIFNNMYKLGSSYSEISKDTGIPKSTIGDFLSKNTYGTWWRSFDGEPKVGISPPLNVNIDDPESPVDPSVDYISVATTKDVPDGCNHFVIPDTQCKGGIDKDYLTWVGKYIVDRKPSVIVHLGDHADMPSLSSYDKGRRTAEGRRVSEDIDAAIEGMNLLLKPLQDLQLEELRRYGYIKYRPKMVLTLGNHEGRITRHVDANPELHGFLSIDDLKYKEMGWEVYDFLEPVIVNGVTYCHYMANPMTGKPYGGMAANILKHVGESFTVGHKQTLEVTTRFLPASGKQQWGIIAGSCYTHDEDYKGYQGNHHWRGVIVKHCVEGGSYNPMFVDLDFLERRFGFDPDINF